MRVLGVLVAICISVVPASAQTSLLGDVAAERAKYGASMSPDQVANLLNAVAWNHRAEGWGLLRKGAGNSCPLAGTFVSCDILIHRGSILHFDVLTDAENTARPQWNVVGPCVLGPSSGCDMSNYMEPVQPAGAAPVFVPPIAVPPPPPIQAIDTAQIKSWIESSAASAVQTLYAQNERMFANEQAEHAVILNQIKEVREKPGAMEQTFTNRWVQLGLAALATFVTTQQAVK